MLIYYSVQNTPLKQQKSVFNPMMCKCPDLPLQDELLCWTFEAYVAFYFVHICRITVDDF